MINTPSANPHVELWPVWPGKLPLRELQSNCFSGPLICRIRLTLSATKPILKRHLWQATSKSEFSLQEVGMAAFDLRTASLHLSQYIESSRSYQNTLTLLQYFDPTELITCASNSGGVASLIEHSSLTNARKVRNLLITKSELGL